MPRFVAAAPISDAGSLDAGGTENANYSEQESICPASRYSNRPAFFIVTISHTRVYRFALFG
jgi:hypothetical protein